MEKKYRYAIRKTTLGVGSVAVAALLASQVQTVQAAELTAENTPELTTIVESTREDLTAPVEAGPALMAEAVNAAQPPAGGETTTATQYQQSKMIPDEKQIQNYSPSERYRQADFTTNDGGPQGSLLVEDNGKTLEGVHLEILNPSSSTPMENQKNFGVQVTLDTDMRTYTGVNITDSVNGAPVDLTKGGFLNEGERLYPTSDGAVNFKPQTEADITKRKQTQFDHALIAEDLQKINSTNQTGKLTYAWRGEYTEPNPNKKIFVGENFAVNFSVNPYPNENKDLKVITLSGETTLSKVPVQGQYIKTNARIDNLNPEDYTRIAGGVYHPNEDILVEGAQAILLSPDNLEAMKTALNDPTLKAGQIVIKMPKGALEDPNSIFNDDKFEGLQNLRVQFFARPRTKVEFEQIVTGINEYGDKFYTETGAGTATITHNGETVTIDKQGIDRYDHYNLVGEMTINLDDTRYYDQNWDEKFQKSGDKITGIKPGQALTIEIKNTNEGVYPNEKTADEMNAAREEGLVKGEIDPSFVKKAEDEGWKIEVIPGDLARFKVTAPTNSKVGDFIALPMTYTYTNGSEDNKWFHFVVQESDNNRPEYHAVVGYQGDTLTNTPELPKEEKDLKKNQPESYELKPGSYTDSAGNVWSDVSIDPQTGVVIAVVPENADIQGGENLFIPVIVHYTDSVTNEAKTEEVSAQFIARPKHQAAGGHAVIEDIPFETTIIYDDSLDIGTVIETKGELGSKRTIYDWNFDSTRKNAAGEDRPVVDKVSETILKEKKDAEIRIGI